MTDKFPKGIRSKIMSSIRSSDTKPELILKKSLRGLYFRYQPRIQGNPDFGLKNRKIVIFVDGCFWHKCPKCYRKPKSNVNYWTPKIKRNVERDKKNTLLLRKKGWKVLRFWEHEINKSSKKCLDKVIKMLKEKAKH